MNAELYVALDIGSAKHRVAIGLAGCREPIEEFDLAHTPAGLSHFFKRVRHHEHTHSAKVYVAMEGFGGYARPLDSRVLAQGWRLYAINNLKFARFKEIFPAPAKTDAIDARRMLDLREAIASLDRQIDVLVEQSVPARRLLCLPGFGPTGAGELAAEIGNIERFADESSFAVYLGVAPLDKSSGKRIGAKLPRQINPRARDALLIAVVHHMSQVPQSRAYYERKRAQRKTHMQALRALARHLARVLFSMLRHHRDYRRPATNAAEST